MTVGLQQDETFLTHCLLLFLLVNPHDYCSILSTASILACEW
ncbi:hypothetical protein VPAL9027_01979 [Vibrio palustris]|uniref:Uncharacterized protein n=1 Tax=Vibrio palustris TaxID=1918946 RepID=A0A1R4B516_9VIBR|nr:hypothetical protein VPAL9027_01979 [Vibrio palustris]